MNKVCQFASIQKVESNDDGTLTVVGIASDGSVDADGETITPDAMRAALPDFMALGTGALREMHQLSAAGTVNEAMVDESGATVITARVVDPVAVLKVRMGVYKGFSVGGSSTSRVGKAITGLRLTEISLVDKPNNPNAVIQMWKCEDFNKTGDTPAQTPENDMSLNVETGAQPGATEGQGVAKTQTGTDIKKGMFDVSDFACFLREIAWMVSDSQWEAESEGDNSPIPDQLKAWLELGVEIFRDMAAEETQELIASLQKAHTANDIQKTETPAIPQPVNLGSEVNITIEHNHPQNQVVEEPVTEPVPVQKASTTDDIAKALAPVMDVVKAMQAQNEALIKSQQELVARVNAMPAAPKGVLVEKAADVTSTGLGNAQPQQQVTPVMKADGSVDKDATMLKSFYAGAEPSSLRPFDIRS